jgi:hypothetical protein
MWAPALWGAPPPQISWGEKTETEKKGNIQTTNKRNQNYF